ncbi:dTDP-glucose 4,6-dehydratase [Streptomyces sp. BHT-5-2]|uniref:dTDP-glucose 4,6-dehydratase n=1 Tax=Streptomyces sp. BHT-5-2 TaxID=2866715 RepID=UPI001C8DC706|nr:dTDP-glucose 4,6-dehydratase [Streptomyces sp. BHT-5-2]QZL07105.1 dTDP-glucose 4,6-dehydratase [Streptomyces sp. BHT-5-2]
MTTQHILVTGGAGFIGSHYARTLLAPGSSSRIRLTVLDKLTYAGDPARLAPVCDDPRFTFVQGDVGDAPLVDELLRTHDQVVHFAAESHVDRSISSAEAFVRTNVLGTHTLLDAALRHGTRTFVQVSTDEVYGSTESASCTEEAPLAPSSPYAASKAAGDLLALSYHRTHGLDVRITRGSNTYGPWQHPEKAVPRFVTELLAGRKVPLYGDGLHVRNWLHLDDHVQGIELARTCGRAGQCYNVGGGTDLSNLRLAELLVALCEAAPDMIEHVADRPGHDRRYAIDITKIRTELGYQPRRRIEEGLAETVAWHRDIQRGIRRQDDGPDGRAPGQRAGGYEELAVSGQ